MNLLLNTDSKDVNKYVKISMDSSILEISKQMREDYLKIEDEKEKLQLKYRLKDVMVDIDKVAYLGIIITLASSLIKEISSMAFKELFGNKYENGPTISIIALFIFMVYKSIQLMFQYRMCSLFITIIDDVEKDEDHKTKEKVKKNIEKIDTKVRTLIEFYKEYQKDRQDLYINITSEKLGLSLASYRVILKKLENEELIKYTDKNEIVINLNGINYVEDFLGIDKSMNNWNKIVEVKKILNTKNL